MVRNCHRLLPDGSTLSAGFLLGDAKPVFRGGHPEGRVLVVLSGTAEIHGDGQPLRTLHGGDWIYRPGHWTHTLRRFPPWKEFFLVLPPPFTAFLPSLAPVPRALHLSISRETRIMETLLANMAHTHSILSLGHLILSYLDTLIHPRVEGSHPEWGKDFLRAMEELPHGPVPVETWCRASGLSPAQFRRRFKKSFGMGPKALHLKSLMERGAALLDTPGVSVHRVSEILGFPDASSFSKQFRNVMGTSPKFWHQRQRG